MTRRFMAMFVLLCVAAVVSIVVRQGKAVPLKRSLDQFPFKVGEWKGIDQGRIPEETLRVLKATDYLNRDYTAPDGRRVNFFISYYASQRAGESMHSPKNCLPGSGWEVLESVRRPMDIPKLQKSVEVNHYVVQNETSKVFVIYWYDTHGRTFASEYEGKGILVWEALKTGLTDGSMIRVMTPFAGSSESAEKTASKFAAEIFPMLRDYLP